MFAPAWVGEAQVLTSAVLCDVLWAVLLRRAMAIFHTDGALLSIFHERKTVETVHELSRHLLLENGMRLLELPSNDLHFDAFGVGWSMALKEGQGVFVKLVVRDMRMQKPNPQERGKISAHGTRPVCRDRKNVLRLLGAPVTFSQNPLQLGVLGAIIGKLHKEAW